MTDRPEDEPPAARSEGVPEPEQVVTLVVVVVVVGIGLAALLLTVLLGYVAYARLVG